MSELKHWLDDSSDSDEFERSILRAGLDADPPPAKRDEIWTGLMATVAVVPLAVATSAQLASAKVATAGVSKAAAVWLAVAKGFVVGLAVYGAAQGVTEISSRFSAPHAPAPSAQPAQRAKTPVPATSHEAEPSSAVSAPSLIATSKEALSTPRAAEAGSGSSQAREPLNAIIPVPSIATFDNREPPAPPRVSQLEAETRALRRARDELRTGKLTDAFATLEASQRQFSAPELYQEREALMIELLYRSGQVTAAERRASAFLSRFPESPHVQQIRRFAAR
jgi:hypothetical protein